jgi:iron complex outermembrane receptor protein
MNKPIKLLATTVSAIALVAPAYAQDDDEKVLDEITVTAEKRDKDLQDTAISIQVYDGEVLLKEGKTRIDEIMNGVVGVKSRDSQVGNLFFMRGVDGGNTAGGPGGQIGTTVSILIDGVYQSRPETVRGGTLDVRQAEVARGTQSTNLGVNTLAGAVSLVTNKPIIDEWETSATIGFGSHDLLDMSGVANVPLTDNSALRFAYSQTNRDGYLSSGAGDSDLRNARLKYRWLPSDALDITLTASQNVIGGNGVQQGVNTLYGYWEPYNALNAGSYDALMGYPPFMGHVPTSESYETRPDPWDDGYPKDVWPNNPFRDTVINSYSADIIWDVSDSLTATIIPSVEKAHFRSAEPPRGTGLSYMAEDVYQDTVQLDARVNGVTDRIDWQAGVYYYDTAYTSWFQDAQYPGASFGPTQVNDAGNPNYNNNRCGFFEGSPGICTNYSYNAANDWNSIAYYGDLTWSITDSLRVQLGLRYSDDERQRVRAATGSTTQRYVQGFDGPAFEGSPYDGNDDQYSVDVNFDGILDITLIPFDGNYVLRDYGTGKWDATTYSLGIEYDVFDDAMVYATFKTGYQPGRINTFGAGAILPENTSEQITLGFKSRWLDNTLQVNAEYFVMNFMDREVRNSNFRVGNTGAASCNAGAQADPEADLFVPLDYACLIPNASYVVDQVSKGIDVEVSWLPTDNDRVDISMELLDAAYDSAPYPVRSSGAYTVDDVIANAIANGGVSDTAAAQALIDAHDAVGQQFNGATLQNAPEFTANVAYTHNFDMSNGRGTIRPKIDAEVSDAYWSYGGAGTFQGFDIRNALDSGSPIRQDSYTLWNASLAWESADGRFTVTGWIRNINDDPILLNVGGEPGSAIAYVSLNPPRTYGITLSGRLQ